MNQSSASSRLSDAVHDLANEVVLALRSGGHLATVCGAAGIHEDDRTGIAAVRVIGADLLLPSVLYGQNPHPGDVAVFHRAVQEFPPRPDSSPSTAWSHWAMLSTLHRVAPSTPTGFPPGGTPALDEPGITGLDEAPWQAFSHQVSLLAPLAVPAAASSVARIARGRVTDLARGFVRAVRRRDWLQASGTGRWLAALGGEPATLGLDRGLDFVELMGGQDPRVALNVRAARLMIEERGR
ncbi:hypothetical protein [Streptomyces sp. NBC_00102]|uniref:hypothetical protein n=1 Tax=Streptomyces sp. NBC_00102 TaxID=2975652 RepID=UPI002256A925|nr:hypothetical protein [Streptomyces sp. NBC_00102]MCX5399055.1 hypothetical protein [Streptomyces sp. NBC_00102]